MQEGKEGDEMRPHGPIGAHRGKLCRPLEGADFWSVDNGEAYTTGK